MNQNQHNSLLRFFLVLLICKLPCISPAQQLNYAPYNPDSNIDGVIGIQDLLDLLQVFGTYWDNYVDDVNSLNEIQSLLLQGDTLTLRPNAELILSDVFGLDIATLTPEEVDSILDPYTSHVILATSNQSSLPSWNEDTVDNLLPTGCFTLFKKDNASPSNKRIIGEFGGHIYYISYAGQVVKLAPDGNWSVIWEVPDPEGSDFISSTFVSKIDSNMVLFLGLTSGFDSHILNLTDNSILSTTYGLPYITQGNYTNFRFNYPWFYTYVSDGTFDGGNYFYNVETGFTIENPWVSNFVTNHSFQFTSENAVSRFLENGNYQTFDILTGQLSTIYFSTPQPTQWSSWNDSLITIHSSLGGAYFDLNAYELPVTTPSISQTWYQVESDNTVIQFMNSDSWANLIQFSGGSFYRNGYTVSLANPTYYKPYSDTFELVCRPFGNGVYYGNKNIVTDIFVNGLNSLLGASYWAVYDL